MSARAFAGRLFQIALVVMSLSFLLFGVLSLLPGDPVDLMILSNPSVRAEDVAALKEQRGLDRPWPVRWWRWLAGFDAPRTPPRAPAIAPVVVELSAAGRAVAQVDVPLSAGESVRAPPGVSVASAPGAARLSLEVTRAGVWSVPFALRDAHGLEDGGVATVFVAPSHDGDDDVDPAERDRMERQRGGSTEAGVESRSVSVEDRMRAARNVGGVGVEALARTFAKGTALSIDESVYCRGAPCSLEIDRSAFLSAGRTVRFGTVTRDDVVVPVGIVVDHGAVGDPGRRVRGAVFALLGDTEALGYSHTYKRPVWELLFGSPIDEGGLARRVQSFGRVQNTLALMVPAMLLAIMASLALGTLAAARPRGVVDRLVGALGVVGVSLPSFWIGIMAVVLFAGTWRVLPAGGAQTPGLPAELGVVIADRIRHAVLPVSVLALVYTASWMRTVRASVLEIMPHPLVRTARAKGASRARALVHALRNALLPFITVVALSVPAVFGGALLTETVFSWPGVGRLQYEAILNNDSYVAIVVLLVSSTLVLLGSLAADLLYAIVDPRMRQGRSG